MPRPGEWIASRTYLERRCPIGAKFASTDKEEAIRKFIQTCAPRYGLDPLLIHAVVSVESNFNSKAVSSRGAMGLMQLTGQTADHLGIRDPFDPKENIEGGIYYLKMLMGRYQENLKLALAAYNAGPEKVKRYRGVPPFPETKKYIRKVMKIYNEMKKRNQKSIAGKPKG